VELRDALEISDWRERFKRLWERLSSGFWFIPAVMTFGSVVLTVGFRVLDRVLERGDLPGEALLDLIAPEAARAALSASATGAITVAGVVFSVTIVVLSTQAAQFGPRLIRNFMRDGHTQFVLGAFISVFVSSLLILTTITDEQVPRLSVIWGIALGVAGFVFLIYFVHHVAVFIQAPRILDSATKHLEASIRNNFPARDDGAVAAAATTIDADWEGSGALVLDQSGYVQLVDLQRLVGVAAEADAVCRLVRRAGQMVLPQQPVLQVLPAAVVDDDERAADLRSCFILGPERTAQQDPVFATQRLVEVALRALSPGINDPFTAINCVDRLGEALGLLAQRQQPGALVRDDDGTPRLQIAPATFAGMVDGSFDPLRRLARTNVALALRLLRVMDMLAAGELPAPMRDALVAQADAIYQGTRDQFAFPRDREELESRYAAFCRAGRAAHG
jgi:uncharacterized membrane protein